MVLSESLFLLITDTDHFDMAHLPILESFDCEGDLTSLGSRWEKWKRALEIFLLAISVEDHAKKRATLLHSGGLALQEIYYNLPGAHVETTDGVDVFKIAISKLDEYFSPKQSFLYERHMFRLMKQEPDEKFDKFVVRLRHQSKKCKFSDANENLVDQITEKCTSAKLRKKILLLGDTVTIEKIITEANALETVERQLTNFDGKPINCNINKIDVKTNKSQPDCFRCGSGLHKSDSKSCPALDKTCRKCGFRGHFQRHCRTKASKRKNILNHSDNPKRFKENTNKTAVLKPTKNESTVDYIFHLDDDSEICCQVGGVALKMLIDSGSKCNIINDQTWEYLKQSSVKVSNQNANPDKILMAYGSKEPLKILGSFESSIHVGQECQTATFYVVRNGTRNLLGKDTSLALNILKLGVSINTVSYNQFPKFKNIELDIAIDSTIRPVCQPIRRVPIPLENKINEKIDELLKLDIIEAVNQPSAWVSPVVPVMKNDGDVRLCVDMRCANKAIERENHPLPTMNQLVPKFRKSTVFSKIDIKNAFHQVEIKEHCREITTFITGKGLYRYKRLMFGMSCAPEHFQKIIEGMLLPCEGVVNFIDDIVVFGKNEEEHRARLNHVLSVLKENNVLLNDNKCIFNAKCIQFLGHELSADGIKPLDKYIDGIKSFRTPKTVDEVQSFLGLVTYIGKWVPNLATLTEPIRQILRQKLHKHADISIHWGSVQQTSFDKIKQQLGDVKTLGYYDPNDKTQVMADASPVGLGAILIQIDSNGPRIIAYGNKSLSDVEKRYCQTEKEALALVWAIEHFRMYLYGLKGFELITDHKPLEVIFGPRSKPSARIERWVLRLQGYNYKTIYRPGKNNLADPFSRLCVNSNKQPFDDECYVNQIVQYARPIAVTLHEIRSASVEDPEIRLVLKGLIHNDWDVSISQYKLFEHELWSHEDILLRGTKIVVPTKLRSRILAAAHEGHPGIVNMKARLRTKVWWPKIDRDAETSVKCCKGCTLVSGPNPPNPMKRRELPAQPWVDIAIDFLGPLPSSHHLLVVIDFFSRYKEIKIMKSIMTKDVTSELKEIFSRLGIPASVTADNGPQFASEEFRLFCSELGIKLFNTIPYWPQQNGEVERQNRDILKRLKISQTQKSDWKNDLLDYLIMYNSTPHRTTGKSPSDLFFNRPFRDKIPFAGDLENKGTNDEVRDRDHEMKEKGKCYEDKKRRASKSDLRIGEKVYVKNMNKENKLCSDFNPAPHTVTSTKDGDINVKNDVTGREYRRNVIHLKRVEGCNWKVCNQEEPEKEEDGRVPCEKVEEEILDE